MSDDCLTMTADLIDDFDYRLLTSDDSRLRRSAVLWLALLVGRPRLGKHLIDSQSKIGRSVRLPFVFKDSMMVYQRSTDGDSRQQQTTTANILKGGRQNLFDRYLVVKFSGVPGKETFKGCVELSRLSQSSKDLQDLAAEMPDPATDQIAMWLHPLWSKTCKFEYIRVGGGEEELPSCSTSSSESIDSESDKVNTTKLRKNAKFEQKSKKDENILKPAASQSLQKDKKVVIVPKLKLPAGENSDQSQKAFRKAFIQSIQPRISNCHDIISMQESVSPVARFSRPLAAGQVFGPRLKPQQAGSASPRKLAAFKITTRKQASPAKTVHLTARPGRVSPIGQERGFFKQSVGTLTERSTKRGISLKVIAK